MLTIHLPVFQVEFNKAAQSLTDALLIPSAQKKSTLGRLIKVVYLLNCHMSFI